MERCDMIRKNKDKTVGNGGKKFMEKIYEKRWYILHGRTEGDYTREKNIRT